MKNNFFKFLLLILVASKIVKSSQLIWKVNELYNMIKNENFENIIIDPDNFLNEQTKKKILENFSNLSKRKNSNSILLIINQIEILSEKIKTEKQFNNFLEELITKIFNDNKIDKNTIFSFFSMSDNFFKIKTGDYIKNDLAESEIQVIIKIFKNDLKIKKIDFGFEKLIRNINLCSSNEDKSICEQSIFSIDNFLIILFMIFFIIFIYNIIEFCYYTKKKRIKKKIFESFLKIKEIIKMDPFMEIYLNKHCIICLEKFFEDDKINSDENLFKLKTLICDHVFHKNCFLKWKKKFNFCPICENHDFIAFENLNEEKEDVEEFEKHLEEQNLEFFLLNVKKKQFSKYFTAEQIEDMYYKNIWKE